MGTTNTLYLPHRINIAMRFNFNTIFYVQYRSEEISPAAHLISNDICATLPSPFLGPQGIFASPKTFQLFAAFPQFLKPLKAGTAPGGGCLPRSVSLPACAAFQLPVSRQLSPESGLLGLESDTRSVPGDLPSCYQDTSSASGTVLSGKSDSSLCETSLKRWQVNLPVSVLFFYEVNCRQPIPLVIKGSE